MAENDMPFGTKEQVSLLLEHSVAAQGITNLVSAAAEATGISYQTLVNLVHGRATNPRLKTLLALCEYFGISLDYFACETEDACLEYLMRQRKNAATPLIHEIERAVTQLSSKGQRNVLTMMAWMESAKQEP